MNLKRRWKALLAIGIVTAVGGGFAYHTVAQSQGLKAQPFKPQLNPNGTESVVRGYRIGDQTSTVNKTTLTGSLQPRFQSPMGFRVAGKIAARHVEIGTFVKQGELLFSLDPVDFELQLRMSEADVISAEAQVKQASNEEVRLSKLRSTSAISQLEYDMVLSARDVARARLDSAKKRLEVVQNQRTYCDLRADRDGQVVALGGEVGQVVNVGQPVLTLMQGTELEVLVNVPENQVALLQTSKAIASIWSNSEVKMDAQLRELSPMADAMTRTFDAKFKLIEPAQHLSPGMTASIDLVSDQTNRLQIPMSSMAKQLDQTIVWKIDTKTGAVQSIPVQVEAYHTNTAFVTGNLMPGDWIVSAGVQRVDQDVKVRLWNESQP